MTVNVIVENGSLILKVEASANTDNPHKVVLTYENALYVRGHTHIRLQQLRCSPREPIVVGARRVKGLVLQADRSGPNADPTNMGNVAKGRCRMNLDRVS